MADFPHDIDDLFHDRFDSLKDHSVDPQSQWASFEQMLDEEQPAVKPPKVRLKRSLVAAGVVTTLAASSTLWFLPNVTPSFAERTQRTVFTDISNVSSQNAPTSLSVEINKSKQFNSPLAFSSNKSFNTSNIEASSSSLENKKDELLAASSQSSNKGFYYESDINKRVDIDKIPSLTFAPQAMLSVAERDLNEDFTFFANAKNVETFIRTGVRFGSGESNSIGQPNAWTASLLATAGFTKMIDDKFGISAELGYIRRSGNGLERKELMDVESIITAFSNSFPNGNDDPTAENEFTVAKSLVAERLDFVHIPISGVFNVSEIVQLSAGLYADILFRAQNRAYTVYNETEYVSRFADQEEITSLKGLNRTRFGVLAGVNYAISELISIDLRASTRLNDPIRASLRESSTSRPIDLQFGLRFSI